MALSAFKSTSKRGTTTTDPTPSVSRRSRSVSAASRTTHGPAVDEFLIKRDNPLYCCSSSPSSSSSSSSTQGSGKIPAPESLEGEVAGGGRTRGRSVSRSAGVGIGEEKSCGNGKAGRSLSRVDIGRGRRLRSVSRSPRGNLEADLEHQYKPSSRSKQDGKSLTSKGQRKSMVTATEFNAKEQARNLQTWTSRHPVMESWDQASSCLQARNWEDGVSTSSFSEADDPTVLQVSKQRDQGDVGSGAIYETVRSEVRRAVSEIREDLEDVIWRKKPDIVTTENIVDIPAEFLSPDDVAFDYGREYVLKLEQAQERARKLRADLAVEEQREQELSRIVNEITRTPRSSHSRKSCPKKKASIERRRMSRRLTEEAMNYFDECVSISTFDSSDFSSLEDSQTNSVVVVPPMGNSRFFSNEGSTYVVSNFPNGCANHQEEFETQSSLSIASSEAIGTSYYGSKSGNLVHARIDCDNLLDYDMPQYGNLEASSTHDRTETVARDLRQYVKKFERGQRRNDSEHVSVKSSYCSDDYEFRAKAESLIFDSFIHRNRVESGGLLLCNTRIFL